MPGTLYVVATPIGNLEDVTLRALRVLGEVGLIAAEDTRRTAKLLQHYHISTPTTSVHEHNERQKLPRILARLQAGDSVALVADAGTPTISDPGSRLVAAAQQAGIRVEAIPGPSAVLAALVSSGLSAESFTFVGFPPARSNSRKKWLQTLAGESRTIIFFEAPHRIRATLQEAVKIWGDREVALGRELTKRHEELVKGPISRVLNAIPAPRGELTVVVAPIPREIPKEIHGVGPRWSEENKLPTDAAVWSDFCHLTQIEGLSRRVSLTTLAKRFGTSTRTVYAAVERAKKLG